MEKIAFLYATRFDHSVQVDKMAETPFSKEIRICMAAGNIMRKHAAPGAITVMVLTGSITMTSGDESLNLENGEMVCFDANVPHSLEAHTDSVVRLTLSKNDSTRRVVSLV